MDLSGLSESELDDLVAELAEEAPLVSDVRSAVDGLGELASFMAARASLAVRLARSISGPKVRPADIPKLSAELRAVMAELEATGDDDDDADGGFGDLPTPVGHPSQN